MFFVMDAFIKWESLARRKYDYVYGETAFDKKLFRDAMKLAFEMFCQLGETKKLSVTRKDVTGDPHFCVLDCCQVIQHMSEYAAECFVEDESKDLIFTASQYAVRIFLNNLRVHWHFDEDQPVLTDEMGFCDEERAYPYNVETGDLSDLQKLAQYRASWD